MMRCKLPILGYLESQFLQISAVFMLAYYMHKELEGV